MSGGFTVDPGLLVEHGDAVAGFAGRLRTAADAAGYTVGQDAYGQVGRLFAGAVVEASQRAAAAVARIAESTEEHARDLHACAAAYRRADAAFDELVPGP